MKFLRTISPIIYITIGIIASEVNLFGYKQHTKVVIIGILGICFIDYIVSTILLFRRYTLLQTNYDNFYRIINIVVGLICTTLFIYTWEHLFVFGWILLLFGFLGLFNGIIYQNSVQIRKKSNSLIVRYKHRGEKTIDNLDSIIYASNKLTLAENDRIIEINDLKNIENNMKMVINFFKSNYPGLELRIE